MTLLITLGLIAYLVNIRFEEGREAWERLDDKK